MFRRVRSKAVSRPVYFTASISAVTTAQSLNVRNRIIERARESSLVLREHGWFNFRDPITFALNVKLI